MTTKITEITMRENELLRAYRGNIPEASDDWNNLQREKIAAVFEMSGKAYIGKVNLYGDEREVLSGDAVFVEYSGEIVYNFDADFIVPAADSVLAEMIVQWNTEGLPKTLNLIGKITNRIDEIGGINLMWS